MPAPFNPSLSFRFSHKNPPAQFGPLHFKEILQELSNVTYSDKYVQDRGHLAQLDEHEIKIRNKMPPKERKRTSVGLVICLRIGASAGLL